MRLNRLLLRLAMLLLLPVSSPGNSQSKARNASTGKVGLVTRDYTPKEQRNWRGTEVHHLHVVIWYPADEGASEVRQTLPQSSSPLFEAGSAMPHGAFRPALENRPLVLLSPGIPGPAEQMAWLGIALARAGFIAAAVDHPGSDGWPTGGTQGTALDTEDPGRGSLTAAGFTLWWERAIDLSDALDGLLADPELSKYIDRERVGAAGYSLGGYTVLELGGARTDISQFYEMCRKNGDDPACHVPKELKFPVSTFSDPDGTGQGTAPKTSPGARAPSTPEKVLEAVRQGNRESLARSGESYKDPRIRAVVALAPDYAFTLTPESLKQMRVPVLTVLGAEDRVVAVSGKAGPLQGQVRGGRVSVLPGVGHYTFLDVCTSAAQTYLPQLCAEAPGIDRGLVHQQVGEIIVAFLEKALR